MNIKGWLTDLSKSFTAAGFEQPQFEARQLLQDALGLQAADLILRQDEEIETEDERKLRNWKAERLRGKPLAYLSGRKGFYKREFCIEPGVLVPRPETELVVTTALARAARSRLMVDRVADLGCGSGCIGLSLLGDWPAAKLTAVDTCSIACRVTLQNARALGLSLRTQVVNEAVDVWGCVTGYHVIVANPPYVPSGDPRVQASVHAYEPHAALYSGPDGLEAFRTWTPIAYSCLANGGLFVCEFGAGQTKDVEEIIRKAGFKDVEVARDLAGHERVISACK